MHIFSSLLEVSFLKIYGKLRKNIHHFKYVCRKQGYFLFALQKYVSSRQLLLGFTYTQTYPVLTGPHLSLTFITFILCLGVSFKTALEADVDRACGYWEWVLVAHGSVKHPKGHSKK